MIQHHTFICLIRMQILSSEERKQLGASQAFDIFVYFSNNQM